ncbi:hypothetical protein ACFQGX_35510 [Nonomuraea dietziae]|uniref:hypothetical protein n=1 Tax=Nonomuraea dietziae TaxID=65515 RepID=UPI003612D409
MLVELFGSHELVVTVKQAIPWGLIVLIPALALTGASGFSIAGNRSGTRIDGKRRRMLVIAGIGLLVLTRRSTCPPAPRSPRSSPWSRRWSCSRARSA